VLWGGVGGLLVGDVGVWWVLLMVFWWVRGGRGGCGVGEG
jgi:hypothetical protein